ncbi:hypothetical protein [Siccirubricoccus phaeus]|uniref:hypothetical protein n=1 Tax=Siccirubricoccus phaeus TaxID=2595053 RepID=UPI0011F3CE5A|nr:hypothetical protein [Siccirubricoccus phaeus]
MPSLVFRRRTATAHRLLSGGSEPCAVPPSHDAAVTVILRATTPGTPDGRANMVEPFARTKPTWHRRIDRHMDHAPQLAITSGERNASPHAAEPAA